MKEFYYTSEKNVQIVIALLKAYGIKKVIASPGTTNMTFVGSIQNDPFFEIYSSVDERSAAYIACGLAYESEEPVVLSCTGATASRNYMPGLTEAFYRKLPILAITSHRGDASIGHLIDQQIDRRSIPNDIAVCSVTVPMVRNKRDEDFCIIETTKAILSLTHRGGGPAHINLFTDYSQDFSIKGLPTIRKIERHTVFDNLPDIPAGARVAIFIGSHRTITGPETEAIDSFCEAHNATVFCDHTSGYHGRFETHFSILFSQENYKTSLQEVDILIHIGEVSGDVAKIFTPTVWRISEDGELRNTFGKLSHMFEMPEQFFFQAYTPENYSPRTDYFDACQEELKSAISKMPELPFSNVWIAKEIHDKLPQGSYFHMGIYNSLRSYNFFPLHKSIRSSCNVGGFGIDGGISSMMGASLAHPDKLHIGVFGDLAFFYDMNVCGNRHVGNNVRILLINNGKGNEFRNYGHICSVLGEEADKYIAAAGHYGNKSSSLVKHYAEDLGYVYLSSDNKTDFQSKIGQFLNPEIGQSPIIFEVFTETEGESEAIRIIRTFLIDKKTAIRNKIIGTVRGAIGRKGVDALKILLGK